MSHAVNCERNQAIPKCANDRGLVRHGQVVRASNRLTSDQAFFFFCREKKRTPDRRLRSNRKVMGSMPVVNLEFFFVPRSWHEITSFSNANEANTGNIVNNKRNLQFMFFLLSETCFPMMIRQYQNLFTDSATQANIKSWNDLLLLCQYSFIVSAISVNQQLYLNVNGLLYDEKKIANCNHREMEVHITKFTHFTVRCSLLLYKEKLWQI